MDGALTPSTDLREVVLDRIRLAASRTAEAVDRDAAFPEAALAAMREARLLGMMVPVALGGAGASLAAIAQLCHRTAQGCASAAMVFAMHQSQVACILGHAGDSPWHRDCLARIAQSELLLASVTSEAGVGGNIRRSLCAVEDAVADRIALAKSATAVSYGAQADLLLLTARRHPESASSDQVLVVLEREDVRLERSGSWNTLGMRGTCSDPFRIKATARPEQILPAPYAEIASCTMQPVAHILWGAVWTGIAADALARARAFLRAESRASGALPAGTTRLAEAAALLQGAEATIAGAIRAYGEPGRRNGPVDGAAMNLLKTSVSESALQVVQIALRICGIAGYRNDGPYSLARHLRDVLSAPLMVNNDRIQANTGPLLLMQPPVTGSFA